MILNKNRLFKPYNWLLVLEILDAIYNCVLIISIWQEYLIPYKCLQRNAYR